MRSFFVGPIEEPHVKKILEKLGGPELKVSITLNMKSYRAKRLLRLQPKYFLLQVNPSRKSVTIGWSKHGGLASSSEPHIFILP